MPIKVRYQAGLNEFDYQILLSIEHPNIDPAQVTSSLSIQPQTAHRVGDSRQTPKGRPLHGTYEKTYWGADLELCDGKDVAEALKSILETLRPHQEFLRALAGQGGLIELYIQFFATRLCDYTLPHSLLLELGDNCIDLRLDFYGRPAHSSSTD
jgi:hypothetical protein